MLLVVKYRMPNKSQDTRDLKKVKEYNNILIINDVSWCCSGAFGRDEIKTFKELSIDEIYKIVKEIYGNNLLSCKYIELI